MHYTNPADSYWFSLHMEAQGEGIVAVAYSMRHCLLALFPLPMHANFSTLRTVSIKFPIEH